MEINSLSSDNRNIGEVVFKIPKFTFSSELKLLDLAKKLGIKNAFENTADLTPLSDTKPLFISDISKLRKEIDELYENMGKINLSKTKNT